MNVSLLKGKAKSIGVSLNDLLMGICLNAVGKLGKGEDFGHKL